MSTAPRIAGTGQSVSHHEAPNAVAWMPSTAIRGQRACTKKYGKKPSQRQGIR